MTKWKPIGTAPKDTSDILLNVRTRYDEDVVVGAWWTGTGGWRIDGRPMNPNLIATHWCPLPDPPSAKGEGS